LLKRQIEINRRGGREEDTRRRRVLPKTDEKLEGEFTTLTERNSQSSFRICEPSGRFYLPKYCPCGSDGKYEQAAL
jgi:hypothetical protein